MYQTVDHLADYRDPLVLILNNGFETRQLEVPIFFQKQA